ncbi:MAG: hypothetical protein AAGE98_07680 [Actinomycetota bacterium]
MTHIVIHEDSAGTTQYRQFDDLGSAVQFIEELRNAGVESARLFEMNEIHLAVKSYFKVEVAEATEAAAPAAPAVPAPAPEAPEAPAAPVMDTPAMDTPIAPLEVEAVPAAVADAVAEPIDDVSYVEAAMASPIEAFATEAPPLSEYNDAPEPAPSTEVRRGLFGR